MGTPFSGEALQQTDCKGIFHAFHEIMQPTSPSSMQSVCDSIGVFMRKLVILLSCLFGAISMAGAAFAAKPGDLGDAQPFSFDILTQQAKERAAKPYVKPTLPDVPLLGKISLEDRDHILPRKDATQMIGKNVPVQFFQLSGAFMQRVRLYKVDGDKAREILYSPDYFDIPADNPARNLPDNIGFAGFRLMYPDMATDWFSFLGASYFRGDGQRHQYGLSARGLAIDTGLSRPEEFPNFTAFWFAKPDNDKDDLIIYARMDSPSVEGAYKFTIRNSKDGQVVEVENHLFFRDRVGRVGIAPMTSMFWYSETNRASGRDWRDEVHDSDGLSIITAGGEHIWRPLNNPAQLRTSSFAATDMKGFGLIQRDRDFAHYQDDRLWSDRRPSLWIQPLQSFGKGSIQLLELPTDDEVYDNIGAYFVPATLPSAGSELSFKYRMYWQDQPPFDGMGAHVVATRAGEGGLPGQPHLTDQTKVVIDFAGGGLDQLNEGDGVVPVVELSKGQAINPIVRKVRGTNVWRVIFEAKATEADPVDARVYLKHGDDYLTETWLGQITPSMAFKPRPGQ